MPLLCFPRPPPLFSVLDARLLRCLPVCPFVCSYLVSHKPRQTKTKTKNNKINGWRPNSPDTSPVGPAPPCLELERARGQPKLAQEQYRQHNLRLAQSLERRSAAASQQPAPAGANSMPRSNNTRRLIESWQDDLYRDFDSLYTTLCSQSRLAPAPPPLAKAGPAGQLSWSNEASFETRALADSLADVEEALRRAAAGSAELALVSPSSSLGASEQATRADSRNTNQSLPTDGGPALVEEMTLSDLEDEICSSLMATKDAERQRRYQKLLEAVATSPPPAAQSRAPPSSGQQSYLTQLVRQAGDQLLNGRRSRQPISSGLAAALLLQAADSEGPTRN